jgi:hypothetical protein
MKMAAWMAQWMFTYNTPMTMTNFFYVCNFILCFVAVAMGVYAALQFKKVEQYLPADEAFLAAKAEKDAAKAEKKAAKKGE